MASYWIKYVLSREKSEKSECEITLILSQNFAIFFPRPKINLGDQGALRFNHSLRNITVNSSECRTVKFYHIVKNFPTELVGVDKNAFVIANFCYWI